MSVSADYLAWLQETLAPLGAVHSKRMFGGAGILLGEHMLAIVVDDQLWLKADDENRAEFEALDLPRFTYLRLGKQVALNFYMPPDEALESPAELQRWARSAFAAALRSGKATVTRRKKSSTSQS